MMRGGLITLCMFFQREEMQDIKEIFNIGVTTKANGLKL